MSRWKIILIILLVRAMIREQETLFKCPCLRAVQTHWKNVKTWKMKILSIFEKHCLNVRASGLSRPGLVKNLRSFKKIRFPRFLGLLKNLTNENFKLFTFSSQNLYIYLNLLELQLFCNILHISVWVNLHVLLGRTLYFFPLYHIL